MSMERTFATTSIERRMELLLTHSLFDLGKFHIDEFCQKSAFLLRLVTFTFMLSSGHVSRAVVSYEQRNHG